MKRIISILITIILVVGSFAGCKSNNNNSNNNQSQNENENVVSDASWFITYDDVRIEGLSEEGEKQENIVVPANFSTASSLTFNNNEKLKSIKFENPDFELPENAFYGCSNLQKVSLPNNLKVIPKLCFCECINLSQIELPNSVTEIGERAFSRCEKLSELQFKTGLLTIDESAFSYSGLEIIELPNTISAIGADAFRYCDKLTSVKVNDGISAIGKTAFADCHHLKEVSIPESVNSIENSFSHTGTLSEEYDSLTIYVIEGSWADIHFSEYTNGGEYAEKGYQ